MCHKEIQKAQNTKMQNTKNTKYKNTKYKKPKSNAKTHAVCLNVPKRVL